MPEVINTTSYSTKWLKWEEDGWYSREDVTILAGAGSDRVLASGTVVAKITASGKVVQLTPATSDGGQNVLGILLHDTVALNGVDKRAAIVARHAIVSDNGLVWPAGISGPQLVTATGQLKALGIEVREGA